MNEHATIGVVQRDARDMLMYVFVRTGVFCACISETASAHAIFMQCLARLQVILHVQGMIMACLMCSCSCIIANPFQRK